MNNDTQNILKSCVENIFDLNVIPFILCYSFYIMLFLLHVQSNYTRFVVSSSKICSEIFLLSWKYTKLLGFRKNKDLEMKSNGKK